MNLFYNEFILVLGLHKKSMKKNLHILASLILTNGLYAQSNSDTLFFTGSEQTWTVPCGAQNISIITYGAQGAAGSSINPGVNVGGAAGLGNKVDGSWSFINPGEQLFIYVGGQANGAVGGYNGGGNGVENPSGTPSGGGGGATDVRFPTNSLNDRTQVSGGGGGGGNAGLEAFMATISGGDGGNGGGNQVLYGNSLDGQSGTDLTSGTFTFPSATGGTTSAPGVQGNGCSGFLGAVGGTATSFQGANGGQGNNGFGPAQTTMAPSGGGGGGGHTGGNGGGGGSAGTSGCAANGFGPGGGGAAGSNYFDGPVTGENGVWTGNGMVVINYDIVIDSAQIDESFAIPCVGQTVDVVATPLGGTYSISTGEPLFSGSEFSPNAEGAFTIIYTVTDCSVQTVDSFDVEITCDVAGIESNEFEFSFYPNPTNDILTIVSNNTFESIELVDVLGKTVLSFNSNETINIFELPKGIYTIRLNSINGTITKPIIKN